MKRVRIDDGWREYGTSRTKPRKGRPSRAFVYKPRKPANTSPPATIADTLEPADCVFASIMEEISAAAAAERAGWIKLERYLRPRVRVRM